MAAKLPVEKQQEASRRADFDLIRELAALLVETGLSEIEIGEGPSRIRVARKLMGSTTTAVPAATPVVETLAADANDVHMTGTVDANHPGVVISPLVGVVYHAPEPGADEFVKVGDSVSKGDTLFIVEAMKTMNPIRAPHSGQISRILVDNGAPVEYGEVLLVLE